MMVIQHLIRLIVVYRVGVDCFDKARLKGIIACGGVDEAGSVNNFVDIKNKAYKLGKNL